MIASGGVLSDGYGHDGPVVCLGDGQREAYLRDVGMAGLASAWAMARWRLLVYALITDLTDFGNSLFLVIH